MCGAHALCVCRLVGVRNTVCCHRGTAALDRIPASLQPLSVTSVGPRAIIDSYNLIIAYRSTCLFRYDHNKSVGSLVPPASLGPPHRRHALQGFFLTVIDGTMLTSSAHRSQDKCYKPLLCVWSATGAFSRATVVA